MAARAAQATPSAPDAPARGKKRAAPDFAGGPAARYLLLVGVTVLVAIGLLMAFSASSGEATISAVSQQGQVTADQAATSPSITTLLTGLKLSAFQSGFMQLAYIAIGILIALLISRIDYHNFIRFAVPLGFVIIAGLIAVFAFPQTLGAHRWIAIGSLTVQPSELAKPVLLVIGASAFAALRARTTPGQKIVVGDWIVPALFIAVVLGLILLEPDMGTALIICVGLAGAWLLCDLPARFPVGVGAIGAVVLVIRLFSSGGSYGAARINSFIKTWTAGQTDYQVLQAQYALAGGGLTGVGPGLSRQKYSWLTQAQSDFVFAIVGEELGFLGTLAIILAFVLILLCGLRIAARAKDRLGRALAGGAILLLVFQAVLNIFAVTSLIPVTGKPLPFVTAGGTSLVTSFALVGIVLSVSRYGASRPAREVRRPTSHLSLVIGGEASVARPRPAAASAPSPGRKKPAPGTKREETRNGGPGKPSAAPTTPKNKKKPDKKGPQGPASGKGGGSKKPPRAQAPKKKRDRGGRASGKKEDEHEDSIEWRWDGGSHLSGPGSRR